MSKFIGDVSAYAYAVSKGYTGTEEEFAELMASYADVGQTAVDAKDAAVAAKTAAQTAATTATNKASEATAAAQTATTKADEASTSASTAISAKDTAVSASQTATSKATEATTAAGTATTAKNDAVAAKTAAETAQGKAETAQGAAEAVAESIPSDYSQLSEDVTELKSGLTATNAELADVRAAGAAVRGQISDLKDHLNALVYKTSVISTGQGPKYTEYNFVAGKRYIVSLENAGSDGSAVVYTSSDGSDTVQTALSNINTGQTKIFTAAANASYIRGWFTTGNLRLVVSTGELEDIRSNGAEAPYENYNLAIEKRINSATSNVIADAVSNTISYGNKIDTSNATVYVNKRLSGLIANFTPYIANGSDYLLDMEVPSTVEMIWLKKYSGTAQMVILYTQDSKGVNYVPSANTDTNLIYNGTEYIVLDCDAITTAGYSRMILSFDSASTANMYEYDGIRNVRQNLEYVTPLTGLNMFGSIACLGDSYTQGFIVKSDSSAQIAKKPFPAVLHDRLGVDVDNYGVGGTTSKTYITHVDGLPKVLAAPEHDLYMICFGINDSGQSMTIGTVADINDNDYTQNADTFCGNLGKMYQMLVEQFPNARYVFIGNWGVGLWYAAYSPYAKAMQKVAEHFNVPYVDPLDDPFFYSDIFTHDVGGHPTQVGYTGIAYAVERLMAKCIANNYEYYKYAGVETV